MKNIIYLFLALIISLALTSFGHKSTEGTKSITLQATGTKVSAADLNQSKDIISQRLKLVNISSFDIKVSNEKGQLNVILPENTDVSEIEGLLISKGDLAFYETYNRDEIMNLLPQGNQLFKILNRNNLVSPSDPRVGCTADEKLSNSTEVLKSAGPVKDCKFVWGRKSKKMEYCVYALKTSEDGKPLITRQDIESVKIGRTLNTQDIKIQIKLKPSAVKVFADATRRNLDKSIAIVIDDVVCSYPVVRSAIEGGEVEVTGDFTETEGGYFPALFNTGQLPLGFTILK
jgi:SecD/SecF fusion protein